MSKSDIDDVSVVASTTFKPLDFLEEIQRNHELSIKRLVMDIKLTAYAAKDTNTLFTFVTNSTQKYIDDGYSPFHA